MGETWVPSRGASDGRSAPGLRAEARGSERGNPSWLTLPSTLDGPQLFGAVDG